MSPSKLPYFTNYPPMGGPRPPRKFSYNYSSGQKKVPVPFSYYDRITVLPFLLRSCESIAGTVRNNNRFSIVLTRGKDKIRARAAAMVFSTYKLQRILFYFFQGYKSPTIARFLKEKDGMVASRRGIAKFLVKYREMESIGRRSGSGGPSKLTRGEGVRRGTDAT